MSGRIDAVRIEIDMDTEVAGEHTTKFVLPPTHPLVQELLKYNQQTLLAAAMADPNPPSLFF